MEFSFEYASSVSNYQEFIVFLEKLQLDYTHNLQEWENPNLEMYLDSMKGWIEDKNVHNQQPTWSYLATMLYAASRYE
ncbi:MAG: hypothetical protein U0264_10655 [Candidatus Kapaibacterium sp.]